MARSATVNPHEMTQRHPLLVSRSSGEWRGSSCARPLPLAAAKDVRSPAGPQCSGVRRQWACQATLAIRVQAGSPILVGVEDVILCLHGHMAYVPASGCAAFVGRESSRRRVIVKLGVCPSAGVRKFLAVLFPEKKVCQRVRHFHGERSFRALLRFPLDLRDLGTLGERLAVARNTGFVSGNYRWIAEDR